jgi:NADH-quinone oxidoreductase subunit M
MNLLSDNLLMAAAKAPSDPQFALLSWTIYSSLIGGFIVMLLPKQQKALIRWVALGTALFGLYCAFKGFMTYHALVNLDPSFGSGDSATNTIADKFKIVAAFPWIPQLGISYLLAVDGINLPLVLLTGIVAVTGILFSWNIEMRTKEFFAFFLILIGGVYGVFMAMDLFLLFVFYELAIIPKYFIIAIWGSTRKEYGAMKLVLYSFVGSAFVFAAMIAMFYAGGAGTFNILAMQERAVFARDFQFWCFPVTFVGFAILAGMWPFHTWAPTGHVAAPTAASMLLAGVVMKLGAYGCLRVAMMLMPEGTQAWIVPMAVIAVINIVYGAGVALVQKDFKFIIGYSSVSHMGFVLLGLITLNSLGMSGAVLQMFSHGVVASLLFAVVGRMVYDRTHTRQLDELGGLAKVMPFAFFAFVVAGLTSMGMPGFSGFVAEMQVLGGALDVRWESVTSDWPSWMRYVASGPVLAVLGAVGVVITVAYIWNAVNKVFLGGAEDEQKSHGHVHEGAEAAITHSTVPNGHGHGAGGWSDLPPITLPEKIAAVILMACMVIVGLYPRIMLDMINNSLQPLLEIFRNLK